MVQEPEFNCKAIISLEGDPKTLDIAISPENATMPGDATCRTELKQDGVTVTVEGRMTLGRLKHTVDDVLKAASLAISIEEELNKDP